MRTTTRLNAAIGLFALAMTGTLESAHAAAPSAKPASAAPCDRACLRGLITQYIDALVAGDPSRLPMADRFRFTEDSSELKLGEGLWKSVTGKGGFRQDYLDTTKQIAAAHIELKEGRNPVLFSLVLHVEAGRIAGVETLVQRFNPSSRFQPKVLGSPIKGMNDPVPADRRQSREAMIKTALTYTEGLKIGNFTDGGTPFASGAYRVENGVVTAGEGCGRGDCGLYSQNIFVHPAILASVAAVDEENGTVLLWMNFGDTGSYEPGNALITFEAFKVWGGEIHAILAFLRTQPQATARFWPSSDRIPKP